MNNACYKQFVILLAFLSLVSASCYSQTETKTKQNTGGKLSDMAKAATGFLQTLSNDQQTKIQFVFNDEERYNWNYVPRSRKGLTLNEMNDQQVNGFCTFTYSTK